MIIPPIRKRERYSPESCLQDRDINCCKLQKHSAQDSIDQGGPVCENSQGKDREPVRTPVKRVEHQRNHNQGEDQSLDLWKRHSFFKSPGKNSKRLDCNQAPNPRLAMSILLETSPSVDFLGFCFISPPCQELPEKAPLEEAHL